MVCFPASKWLVVGSQTEREHFLKKVQLLGIIEFEDKGSSNLHIFGDYQLISNALLLCITQDPCEIATLEKEHVILDRASNLAKNILFLTEKRKSLQMSKEALLREEKKLLPFGSFRKDEIEKIETNLKTKIYFLSLNVKEFDSKYKDDSRLVELSCDGLVWHGILFGEDPDLKDSIVQVESDSYHVTSDLISIDEQIAELDCELNKQSTERPYLERAKKILLNRFHLHQAEKSTVDKDGAFWAFIWVHPNYESQLGVLATEHSVYLERSCIDEMEIAPTVFQNEGYSRIGQELVEVYDVPSTYDQDPSLSVLISFAIFFGLIMADLGYGLVILLPSLYLHYRKQISFSESSKRMIGLGIILGSATSVWGGIIGSFFGVNFSSRFSPLQFLAEK
ncbi:V-type ATPase 116kDa subunit family protein, partial [Candidatus Similichlamydia epinepheli]|uniref:V-type ATPase 116kDa subunit family protein n=1 Tax=Candidatus Similichlamydia epinepheli TaxID=1903953 RepID=UPI00130053FC